MMIPRPGGQYQMKYTAVAAVTARARITHTTTEKNLAAPFVPRTFASFSLRGMMIQKIAA